MKSAVTICLVSEARSGPFVYHKGLAHGCQQAVELGFDAVEVFPPRAQDVSESELRSLLNQHSLALAAMGTGAGWLLHQWSLSSADSEVRQQACQFIRDIIDRAGALGAPAIVGSMQGKIDPNRSRNEALQLLADGLSELADYAERAHGVPLLFEPLNRYESNLFNRLEETADWLTSHQLRNVKILADMFHMNIEEGNMSQAIERAGGLIGHVHFADSNRLAIGLGHTDTTPVIASLKSIGYAGYLSAEIFPKPDSDAAARQTMQSFKQLVG